MARYWCQRCQTDVVNGRCRCLTSPSPWVKKPMRTEVALIILLAIALIVAFA